ncbi:MAG: hydroxypyruvate isomerase family protein [Alphaproteobacteria bacterium]|nr:hydroxypyruvate isomerase family protein [Alphaproteobacteria bacterium]
MPRFAANLSWLFQDVPFLERFARAKAAGFEAVEFLFPYDLPAETIAAEARKHGLQVVLFNMPPGDWARGERGTACYEDRMQEFADGVQKALAYAKVLGCKTLHCMSGIPPAGANRDVAWSVYCENLHMAAAVAAKDDVTVVIEPINGRDMPGYLLQHQEEAIQAIESFGAPQNLGIQFDVYHCQIMDGDLTTRIRRNFGLIKHVQVAGVPLRNEPDFGEVNYAYIFAMLDAFRYKGWVGCEYRPRGRTEDGLGWLRAAKAASAVA